MLALAACNSSGATAQGVNNPDGGTFNVGDIKDSPDKYVGAINLIGIVGDSRTQDFSLLTEADTFYVLVDYRGSQALPQLGDTVQVEGSLWENRPCCGPGFTITSTQFKAVE